MPSADRLARLLARRRRLVPIAAGLLGVALTLSFAPFGAYPLGLLVPLPLMVVFFLSAPRDAARIGYAFGSGLFLAGTYWLYVSIHVFGQAPLLVAIVLMLGLVALMAAYYGAAGWLISRLAAGDLARFVPVAPAIWVLLEWARGWLLTGFPWLTLGYGQIDSPLAAIAPLGGVYAVSLAVAICAAALAATTLSRGRRRAGFLGIALAPWILAIALDHVAWTRVAGSPVRTTIVQGGVSQDLKWLPTQFPATIDLYAGSLRDNAGSELIVWPEVAIPAVLDQVESYVEEWRGALGEDRTLLFGILERDDNRRRVYNSVVAVGAGPQQVYRKRHLVPFGEYFPVPDFVRDWMRLMNLPYVDISPGAEPQPLLALPGERQLAVAICYEDAYGAEQLYALPSASILVNVSNDAWFGDSIAPHQHLEIARMRALETGRSVIRATNNGVSAFIGPRGEILDAGPQFEFAALTRDVVPRTGLTPYARYGNWPVLAVALAMLLPLVRRRATANLLDY